jgi:hypothetical protein
MLQAHNKPNMGLDVCDKPETWFAWVQSVFGHHPSFLRKRWIRAKGRQGNKEAGSTFVLHANKNYVHIISTQ